MDNGEPRYGYGSYYRPELYLEPIAPYPSGVRCPQCRAKAGEPCKIKNNQPDWVWHKRRKGSWNKEAWKLEGRYVKTGGDYGIPAKALTK